MHWCCDHILLGGIYREGRNIKPFMDLHLISPPVFKWVLAIKYDQEYVYEKTTVRWGLGLQTAFQAYPASGSTNCSFSWILNCCLRHTCICTKCTAHSSVECQNISSPVLSHAVFGLPSWPYLVSSVLVSHVLHTLCSGLLLLWLGCF